MSYFLIVLNIAVFYLFLLGVAEKLDRHLERNEKEFD